MSSATGSKSPETVHYDIFFLTWPRGQLPDDSLQLALNPFWDQEARTIQDHSAYVSAVAFQSCLSLELG